MRGKKKKKERNEGRRGNSIGGILPLTLHASRFVSLRCIWASKSMERAAV